MNNWNTHQDDYDDYLEQFNPMLNDRQARRKRKSKARHNPKKDQSEIVQEIADTSMTLEGGFEITYNPSLHEAGWLLESLNGFYERALIVDILAQVKGGKEASVYRCQAHPSVDDAIYLAAKVYRPRMFRQLRNDAMYREGRTVIGQDGKEVTERNKREMRAMRVKSSFGQQMAHTSWLMHEYNTLEKLYQAGAAVPKPYANGMNALLMGYVGDGQTAASTLIEIDLEPDEADDLFQEALRNIELMLSMGIIHGDLSAYNILYWDGKITLIDFPQVTPVSSNPNAHDILERDVKRVCDYFSKQGVKCNAEKITRRLWSKYGFERDTTNYDE
ncbi:MAG: hypothetical protein KC615_02370 [Anaerolineae bacterium]|nr:hypothetical protein [Anaerolineae bacterium]MCA9891798.1 hypothetical protein [Anaerolineae bacterium]